MLQIIKNNYKLVFILLSIITVIPSTLGILHSGFPLTDDGNWMVIRFSAFFEAFRSGQFPVRFLMRLNNGFGYPVADFLYPLYMYLGVPIHVLGFNFVNTVKVILITCIVTSSLFSFLWLRKVFDNFSAFLGSVIFTLFPYHLFDIYKRGSVGEVLSLSIIPFVLWQIERKSMFWLSIGIGMLILAHNTLAVLFMGFIILYTALRILDAKEKIKLLRLYILSILFGLGLSAFFWIPAVLDLQYTVFSKTQVSNISNYFTDFNLIGFSAVFIIVSILVFTLLSKIQIKQRKITFLMLFLGLVSMFFASSLSEFFWKILPTNFIQFPFRLLSITMVCTAFLGALLVSVVSSKSKLVFALIIILLSFISALPFLSAKEYQYLPDTFYSTNQDTTTVKQEYMPIWVKNIPTAMFKEKVENINGVEKINLISSTAKKTVFETYLSVPREIQINTVYFPGWKAYVNGNITTINYNNPKGLINLHLDKGKSRVEVIFRETNIRFIADIISVMSILGLVFLSFYYEKHK